GPGGAARADRAARQADSGVASGQPVQPPAERDRRLWTDPLERSGAADATAAALRLWPRPVGLDRLCAQAELLPWQGSAGSDQQEGRRLPAPAADQRRPGFAIITPAIRSNTVATWSSRWAGISTRCFRL